MQTIWKSQFSRRCSHLAIKNTIFALSSGHGKCGVSVIRVSGPDTLNVLKSMACFPDQKVPKPRYASLRNIVDPVSKVVLDEGLCLWFPKPNSFTGEDCCEFQVHGSIAVINAILGALTKLPGLRPAEPGEFSKRAFFNNKLDLTQTEALGDLIQAETELQRQKALHQMKGNLKQLYSEWRQLILECLASVEAYIDFSEDEIIEDNILNTVRSQVVQLHGSIEKHIELSNKCGVRIRSGIKSVIVGEPNVGKSSLMNFLCQKQISIVTSIPGTTRDVIEKHLDIGGYPVILLDTAGLRSTTSDIIETEGIDRARTELTHSDLTLILIAFTPELIQDFKSHLNTYIHDVLNLEEDVDSILTETSKQASTSLHLEDKRYLIVINKLDLATPELQVELCDRTMSYSNVVAVSCKLGYHMDRLLECMQNQLTLLCGQLNQPTLSFTQARHAAHLHSTVRHLSEYLALSGSGREFDLTLAAQELRLAARGLGSITGDVRIEEVLDVIFSQFCIGK
ncbi:hypothetical protein M8J75_010195 [Diaphorina citri]|nr:hypothetical protein M8J75_010195 [Diaphorina citri]